jgi:hypothetical protein
MEWSLAEGLAAQHTISVVHACEGSWLASLKPQTLCFHIVAGTQTCFHPGKVARARTAGAMQVTSQRKQHL